MTYLQFLLVFLLPPILLVFLLQTRKSNQLSIKNAYSWIVTLSIIAFIYTTPWDNYLVYRQVWSYGRDRVLGTIGYVPYEEYIFFLLQPLLTGLWLIAVLRWLTREERVSPGGQRSWMVGFWALCTFCGVLLLYGSKTNPQLLYLGLILTWACPVLAGMAWLSADTFWTYRRAWALGSLVPTLYLWVVDRFAIDRGIWDISATYSLNVRPFGLPVEEAVFFLVTNLLVVQGLLMLLPLSDSDIDLQ